MTSEEIQKNAARIFRVVFKSHNPKKYSKFTGAEIWPSGADLTISYRRADDEPDEDWFWTVNVPAVWLECSKKTLENEAYKYWCSKKED